MTETSTEKPISRQQKWSDAHPQERWAHMALRSAVRRGLVVKGPCEECGDKNSEAHHPDYSRPMHVKWLCRPCHKAEHRRMKGGVDAQP